MRDKTNIKIITNLAEQRIIAGKSQEKAAELLGIPSKSYSKIECGDKELKIDSIPLIAEFYSTDPLYIMTAEQYCPYSNVSFLQAWHNKETKAILQEIIKLLLKLSSSYSSKSNNIQTISKEQGNRIAESRKKRNMSCNQIAGSLNMNVSTYNNVEKGNTSITIGKLNNLAEKLKVTPFYILTGCTPSDNEELTYIFASHPPKTVEKVCQLINGILR